MLDLGFILVVNISRVLFKINRVETVGWVGECVTPVLVRSVNLSTLVYSP